MSGQEWVTLVSFAVAMIVLSFFSRTGALWITGAVGLVIFLRHGVQRIPTLPGANGSNGNVK